MTRIVVAGENLIDLIVRADATITPVAGGGPYNTARTIGRLGGEVAYLGRISRDRFGRDIRSRLVADGVSPALVVDTDDPTTLALAELDASGAASYHFYVEGTAASGLEPADVAGAIAADTQAIHAGTLGLVLEPMAQATVALLAAAPPRVLVMVDPNVRPSIVRDAARYRRSLDAALSRADVVKISSEDAAWLAPSQEPRRYATDLVARGARVVLLTDGGDGVVVVARAGTTEVPVPRVAVVDTVGAGDAFGGGFLVSWLDRGLGRDDLGEGDAVLACVERAIRVAAITCTRAGAEPPTKADLGEA